MNGRKIGEALKMLRSALTLQQVLAKSTEIPFLIKQKIFIDREFIDIQKFIPKICAVSRLISAQKLQKHWNPFDSQINLQEL